MKKINVYDSYTRVYDVDGTTLLHEASGSEITAFSNLSYEDACIKVGELFEETKLMGSSFTEVVSQPELGLVEIKVEFSDKKKLHRVIYLKDV
jgi:hypothetical protein